MFGPGTIETPRLQLALCAGEALAKLIAGPRPFEQAFGLRVMPGFLEFPEGLEFALEQMQSQVNDREWWAPILFLHKADRAVIGLGGYKGPPDAAGMVELGYSIAPEYRGQGYATEAARGLLARAFCFPQVRTVRAHTLPRVNASSRVLEKCGFARVGEVVDPSDGWIWRWEIQRRI